jgi:transposase
MATGRRKKEQSHLFLPTAWGGGHRFYEALNKLLVEADFDEKVEALCERHYATSTQPGRPSVAPGIYFQMMLVGFFEGISSERGIAWRCADSMSLRDFLGLAAHVPVPNASTVSRTRRRLPVDVFDEVFRLVLELVDKKALLQGRVRGVDSTYLKADASMHSIVRKDTGEDYRSDMRRVAAEAEAEASTATRGGNGDNSGSSVPPPRAGESDNVADLAEATAAIPPANAAGEKTEQRDVTLSEQSPPTSPESPSSPRRVTTEEAVRHDRRRKKTTSNADWRSPTDAGARIVRMKNGTTRLGYKPQHVVDMEAGAILCVLVHAGDAHDASTITSTLAAAEQNIASIRPSTETPAVVGEHWHREPLAEVVADKGYHKAATLLELKADGYRTCIPERKQRGRRKLSDKGGADAAAAFHQNRARTRRAKGKALQRRRGELVERPNQHLYDRTGLRRLTLTKQREIQKRICLEVIVQSGTGAPQGHRSRGAEVAGRGLRGLAGRLLGRDRRRHRRRAWRWWSSTASVLGAVMADAPRPDCRNRPFHRNLLDGAEHRPRAVWETMKVKHATGLH